jgi:hypothetical protein
MAMKTTRKRYSTVNVLFEQHGRLAGVGMVAVSIISFEG